MRTRSIAAVLVVTLAALVVAPPAVFADGPHPHHGPSTAAVVTGVILGGLIGYWAVKSEPWDERYRPSVPPPPPPPVYQPYPPMSGPYPTYQPLPTRPLPTPGPYPTTSYDPPSAKPAPPAYAPYGSSSPDVYPQAPMPGSAPMPEPVDPRPSDPTLPNSAGGGVLVVRVQPLDADIVIDGELWNRSPGQERLTVTLPAGSHRIDVRKPGYVPFGSDVTVKAGDASTINVSLNSR